MNTRPITKAQAIRLICGDEYICNEGVTDPALAIVKDIDNALFVFMTNLDKTTNIADLQAAYTQITHLRDIVLDCISHPDRA
ncbi:hypothetical protein [Spirosoma gilvum]